MEQHNRPIMWHATLLRLLACVATIARTVARERNMVSALVRTKSSESIARMQHGSRRRACSYVYLAMKVTACPNGSFCCGVNAQDCCNANQGKFIVNNQVADSPGSSSDAGESSSSSKATQTNRVSPASTASNHMTGTASTAYQSDATSSPTSVPETKNGISSTTKSTIIGVSIGIGLGAVVLFAGYMFFWRRRKARRMSDEVDLNKIRESSTNASCASVYESRPELSATQTRTELDAREQSELDSQERVAQKIVAVQINPVEMP
ncbi:transmembrane alpha-helix domain-containing protein [Rutstroemia sp. NJR-2017a BBW]|nr:transmembrane alpha-helix domain-containing protein [Rutstroemia sp. NJR-2017a BBW]